jgi:PEP-CTERM motif
MKLSLKLASGNRALRLSIALTLVFASTSLAEIADSTYDFVTAESGSAVITGSPSGSYTAPANPGFCIGPPNNCVTGGVSSSFAFTNVSPTEDQITFTFFGSSDPVGVSGGFKIDLLNLVTTDGSTMTGITHVSGNFVAGIGDLIGFLSGNSLIFVGTDSTGEGFDADGGAKIVFDVTETGGTSSSPEPASLLLSGLGLAGLAIAGIRRKRQS